MLCGIFDSHGMQNYSKTRSVLSRRHYPVVSATEVIIALSVQNDFGLICAKEDFGLVYRSRIIGENNVLTIRTFLKDMHRIQASHVIQKISIKTKTNSS